MPSKVKKDTVTKDRIELGALSSSLGFLLRMAQLRAFSTFYKHLGKYGLKPGEFSVLSVIGDNPGLPQGTIARKLRIKPAHMTKLMRRMMDAGYVDRETDPVDRRVVHLRLTQAGADFVDSHRAEFLNQKKSEHAPLSDEEVEQLLHLLRKYAGLDQS